MTRTYIPVEVTQEDIEKADPKKSGRCVVARAIARTIPDAHRIEVDVQSIRYTQDGERHIFFTPYPVTGYIVAFDAGKEIHPFRFRLNEAARIGVKQKPKTEAGKRVDAAVTKTRDRQAKLTKLEKAAADPKHPKPPTKAQLQVAREELDEAKAEQETTTKAVASQPKSRTDKSHGIRQAPQRSVWKTGRREYGNRLMSINGGEADQWARPEDEPR
jgi:hypothetical protein